VRPACALQKVKAEGCTLLTGGGRVAGKPKGYWVQPTVFMATPKDTIWNEEIFGPVLACTTFVTEEEAVRLANDSEFGLGAAVISADDEVPAMPPSACMGELVCFPVPSAAKRTGMVFVMLLS
jgi:acyl-CoA reductase-like NAD-dependent aldehyde dehydrogenase